MLHALRDDTGPQLLDNLEVEDRYVTSAGARLHLRWKPAELAAGQRPRVSLLCLHGFLAHAHWFQPLMACLPDDWEVAALSFAGMGQSDWRPSYTREQDWQDVVAVAQELGFANRPVLLGHSFGGAVAIHAMQQAPETFERLIVCDTAMRLSPAPMGNPWRGTRRYYPDRATAEARFRYMPEQPAQKPWVKDFVAHHSIREYEQGWSWVFDPTRISPPESNRDFWNQLITIYEALPQRPLFIRGALSALCSRAWAQDFRAHLGPDWPLVSVEEAYHHLLLDQPAALAKAIMEHLG
jgi:pimeloyl-ACP methyl ester carboxylesterase